MKGIGRIVLYGCVMLLFSVVVAFAQESYLRITSNPEAATVEIAGKNIGKTPLLHVLKPGKYSYTVSLAGYEPVSGTVELIENEVTRLNLNLVKQVQKLPAKTVSPKRVAGKGNLTVLTDWQDVTIYLNGRRVNETPPVTLKDVPAGLASVILVSGDYADSFRILVQPGKTSVLKKNFQEDKIRYESQKPAETVAVETPVEVRRSLLPAKVIVSLNTSVSTDSKKQETPLLGESDSVEITFRYKKSGETEWKENILQSGTKPEDSFEIEKGLYEIQLVAAHYKVPTGLINVLLTKKEKVREYKEAMKKDIQPDTQYKFVITYDGKSFGYKVEEAKLNTPIK